MFVVLPLSFGRVCSPPLSFRAFLPFHSYVCSPPLSFGRVCSPPLSFGRVCSPPLSFGRVCSPPPFIRRVCSPPPFIRRVCSPPPFIRRVCSPPPFIRAFLPFHSARVCSPPPFIPPFIRRVCSPPPFIRRVCSPPPFIRRVCSPPLIPRTLPPFHSVHLPQPPTARRRVIRPVRSPPWVGRRPPGRSLNVRESTFQPPPAHRRVIRLFSPPCNKPPGHSPVHEVHLATNRENINLFNNHHKTLQQTAWSFGLFNIVHLATNRHGSFSCSKSTLQQTAGSFGLFASPPYNPPPTAGSFGLFASPPYNPPRPLPGHSACL
ncbi:unnamed protein product [Acanthosepion pharaonis]|uniref:Uncharacterized protein n=1 Tax=Acanthosepion pharaonis TaxID=158019 RepID=A0A812CXG8_ACAPH|nr:unnamed protein product [Sepia pharaonis]